MSTLPATQPSRQPAKLTRMQRDDYEFLPAVIEILETPLSPVRSWLILAICAFVTIALAWSYFGRIDIIAAAQGKIQPVGRTKTIQPLATGKVAELNVRNGQKVKTGELLITLDAGEDRADQAMFAGDVLSLKAEAARRRVALQAASTGKFDAKLPIAFDADIPTSIANRETAVLVGDLAQLKTSVDALRSQFQEKAATITRLNGTITAQQVLVATLKQRVDMRSELYRRNSESKAAVIDAEETYDTQLTTLATQKGELTEAVNARDTAERQIARTIATFVADNADKLSKAERDIDDDMKKLAKATVRADHMELRSPIDGYVQGLTVTSLGQVVSTGEQIMQIVPSGKALEIEAYLSNSDAGFVKPGQTAAVKIQSFPFTDYGTIDAQVTQVADDAIPLPDADRSEENPAAASKATAFGGAQRVQNLVFPATLTMDRDTIKTENGTVPLTAGMTVTVEIKTGSRRILSYVAAPLVETLETAFRER